MKNEQPKMKSKKNPKGAGRKKTTDPKDRVILFIKRSLISGKDNPSIEKESTEYAEKLEQLKQEIYETINFTRG